MPFWKALAPMDSLVTRAVPFRRAVVIFRSSRARLLASRMMLLKSVRVTLRFVEALTGVLMVGGEPRREGC